MSLPSKPHQEPVSTSQAPMELRELAHIELKRRRLLTELAEVERHHRQLSQEIEVKRIPIPWLTQHGPASDQ